MKKQKLFLPRALISALNADETSRVGKSGWRRKYPVTLHFPQGWSARLVFGLSVPRLSVTVS